MATVLVVNLMWVKYTQVSSNDIFWFYGIENMNKIKWSLISKMIPVDSYTFCWISLVLAR